MKKEKTSPTLTIDIILEAIEQRDVSLFSQAIYDLNDPEHILYAECLARLTLNGGRSIPASSFVPTLEKRGKVALLDRLMLEAILYKLESDHSAVLGCNLSADTLGSTEHWDELRHILCRHREQTRRLIIEATESSPLKNFDLMAKHLKEAQEIGCRIAIDDFGAGYFATHHLTKMKVDIVKIDASLVQESVTSQKNSLFHMVGLARCAADIVVVEGIETAEHLECARCSGATHVQGYFFSEPVEY